MIGTLLQDIRYGFRMLLKRPGFTMVALITLSLGIGVNTAIFSVVNAVVLRPLPFAEPDRLVMLWGNRPDRERDTVAPANFLDWREQNTVFEEMAGFSYVSFNLVGSGDAERIRGASVSANFFHLLGIQPVLGRALLPTADQAENSAVVVLSYGLWQRRFGADPGIVGKTLVLNDQSYSVLGVMPEDFKWPLINTSESPAAERVEFWTPAPFKDIPQLGNRPDESLPTSRKVSFMRVIGRLQPGVTIEQAQAEMKTIASRLAAQYPDTNKGRSITLVPLQRQIVGNIRPALFLLSAAVGFVLLIACANVANLFLARAATRRREIAVRIALGASRWRLVRQLLTESIMLGLVAGGAGALLALWCVHALVGLSPGDIPRLDEVGVDTKTLAFTLFISLLTGLLFGLLPALQFSKTDMNESLKEGGKTGREIRGRSRNLLVVAEVAIALVLLVGAGLLLKSFLLLQRVKPGFDSNGLLTLKLSLPDTKYSADQQKALAFQQVLERIKALPGVEDAGATLTLPFAGDDINFSLVAEDQPQPAPGEEQRTGYQVASSDYFRTMRIPFVKGRDFTPADKEGAPGVAIINETLARQLWPNEDAVGRRIRLGGPNEPWLSVIGVVGDVRHYGLDKASRSEAYVSYLQSPFSFMDVVVRANGDPLSLVPAIRGAVSDVDKNLPLANIHTMDELLSDSVSHSRFTSLLVALFGTLALLLAAIGIYGVMSYVVSQRTHEIGIRMALGAGQRDIFRLVVGQGLSLALIGAGLGLAASLVSTRAMSSLLFGVSTTDPMIFGAISLLLIVVAFAACYIPARKAMKVDPMEALRYE